MLTLIGRGVLFTIVTQVLEALSWAGCYEADEIGW